MLLYLALLGALSARALAAASCKNQDYSRLKNGKCYRLFKTPMTFSDAVSGCRLTKGRLAVIHNYTDNTEVGVWSAGWSAPEVWIGLVCPTLATCKWQDGSDLDYTNFEDTPPNLRRGTCFYMEAGKVTLTQYNPWQNDACDAQRNFICESVDDEPPAVSTTPRPSAQCGSYTYFGGACYAVKTSSLAAGNAESMCNAEGGHLVSIHDSPTNDFVYELLRSSGVPAAAWIGLKRLSNGADAWTDGTRKDFSMVPTGLVVPAPSSLAMSTTPLILPKEWIPETANVTLPYVCRRAMNN